MALRRSRVRVPLGPLERATGRSLQRNRNGYDEEQYALPAESWAAGCKPNNGIPGNAVRPNSPQSHVAESVEQRNRQHRVRPLQRQ